jgi:hypothetical protein
MLAHQKEMLEALAPQETHPRDVSPDAAEQSPPMVFPREFFDFFESQMAVPPWFATWSLINGCVGLAISAGYFISSVFLLLKKASGIRGFLTFAALAISWALIRGGVALQTDSFMIAGTLPLAVLGLLVHGTLMFVVWHGDKEAFAPGAA